MALLHPQVSCNWRCYTTAATQPELIKRAGSNPHDAHTRAVREQDPLRAAKLAALERHGLGSSAQLPLQADSLPARLLLHFGLVLADSAGAVEQLQAGLRNVPPGSKQGALLTAALLVCLRAACC